MTRRPNPISGRLYILDGHTPVRCDDTLTWAKWTDAALSDGTSWVKRTEFPGGVLVSTIFLGIDHNFWSDGAPVLFETMILGGPHDGAQWRHETWEAAEEGHAFAVAYAKATTTLAPTNN